MMMMLQLAKRRILPFLVAAQHNRRCYSSNPNPNFSVVDYLITRCGVSPDKVASISNHVAHLKSPEKPDAVLRFLNHHGFSEADIKSIVTWQPSILCTSPGNTLEPNLRALRDTGLSIPTIIKIVVSGPSSFECHPCTIVPRIKFWMDFLGGDEAALVRVFKNNRGLVNHDISRLIAPRISLLQSYGLSANDIQRVVYKSRIITRNVGVLEDMLNRAKDLGFRPSSGMFVVGLEVMGCVTREALEKKMNLLKSFGWSENNFFSALQRQPGMAKLTNDHLRVKMNFLLEEAGCDISYITSHPQLLQYSLTKRLRPRLHVLNVLESKGSSISGQGFHTLMKLTNTQFVERYVLPHEDEFPDLGDICPTDHA